MELVNAEANDHECQIYFFVYHILYTYYVVVNKVNSQSSCVYDAIEVQLLASSIALVLP